MSQLSDTTVYAPQTRGLPVLPTSIQRTPGLIIPQRAGWSQGSPFSGQKSLMHYIQVRHDLHSRKSPLLGFIVAPNFQTRMLGFSVSHKEQDLSPDAGLCLMPGRPAFQAKSQSAGGGALLSKQTMQLQKAPMPHHSQACHPNTNEQG